MCLWMDRLECFPPRGPIRVIAAGVGGDVGRVQMLFERIENAAEDFGIQREMRKYTPHATLARCREGIRRAGSWERRVAVDRFPGPEFQVSGFQLVMSTLTAAGSIYETVEKFM